MSLSGSYADLGKLAAAIDRVEATKAVITELAKTSIASSLAASAASDTAKKHLSDPPEDAHPFLQLWFGEDPERADPEIDASIIQDDGNPDALRNETILTFDGHKVIVSSSWIDSSSGEALEGLESADVTPFNRHALPCKCLAIIGLSC
jgi:hypothetical protein